MRTFKIFTAAVIVSILVCVFSLAARADEEITLAWDEPAADIAKGDFGGWTLYSSFTSGGPYSELTSIAYTGAFDYTQAVSIPEVVGAAVTYFFVLDAVDTSGNRSGKSNEVSQTFTDTTAPAKPMTLRLVVSQ